MSRIYNKDSKIIDTDEWIEENHPKNGVFKVSPKNRQKIEINLGPINKIEKYVKQLENKKDKKVNN